MCIRDSTFCVMYWHFLDGVWVVLFIVLLFGMR